MLIAMINLRFYRSVFPFRSRFLSNVTQNLPVCLNREQPELQSDDIEFVNKLVSEGMPEEQAVNLLNLISSLIQSFKEHNLTAVASPEEYQQLISTLRQSHPVFLNESLFLAKRNSTFVEEQAEAFSKELSKSKVDITKLAEDNRTSFKLDASLEKKRLDEVESTLANMRKEGEECSREKVEHMEMLLRKLQKDNYKALIGKNHIILISLLGIGVGLISIYLGYKILKM